MTRWTSEGDVFTAHRVDEQLAKGMDRKVWLPSGGSLVIDRTEAMTVVDVNTGKFTGSGGTLEETVTRNNLEAAEEIVRQLRLRDIGGIIVIDFIDMVLELNRDLVLRRLVECLGRDRTKHQVAEVTSLGLVQMTRKRVGQGLVEAFSETCEHCNGRGFIVHTDPIERGGPPQLQVQTPQPALGGGGGGDGRGGAARRKRGGDKPSVPSGLPMVPVLPEAREAVKATLATIAAAAAHAHEHEHNGHGQAGAGTPAPVRVDLPVGKPADPGAADPDAAAAVTEALAALRLPTGDTAPADDAAPGAVHLAAADDVAPEGAVTDAPATADAESAFATPEWIDADAVGTDSLDTGAFETEPVDEPVDTLAADPADADDALELVPVAPEVFDVPDDQQDDESFDHEGEDGPVDDVAPSSDALAPAPSDALAPAASDADAPHPADGDADGR